MDRTGRKEESRTNAKRSEGGGEGETLAEGRKREKIKLIPLLKVTDKSFLAVEVHEPETN